MSSPTSLAATRQAHEPLISIVTVAYNAEATLEDTIRSVIQQSYRNIEHLIIDGGSTDRTLEIIRQYGDHIRTWVSEPDKGIYDAMNKGARLAKGQWIVFLNSGDVFCNADVLRGIFAGDIAEQTDVIYGNSIHKTRQSVLRSPPAVDRKYFFFETLCHQSVFARRRLFDRIGAFGSQYRIIADREWLFRAITTGARFAHVALEIAVWDPEGFSSANAALSQREVSDFQSRYFSRRDRLLLPWQMRFKNGCRRILSLLYHR